MKTLRLLSFFPGLVGLSCAMACSASSNNGSDTPSAGTGGTGTGGTNGTGTGGGEAGTGGSNPGTGGSSAGTGGSSNGSPAFTCPTGLEGTSPVLTGMAAPVATAPNMDVNGGDQVFLEGPVWANGSLYVSQLRKWGDQPPARILKLEGSGDDQMLTEFIADSGSNGIAVTGAGELVTANHGAFGLVEFPITSGASGTTLVDTFEGTKFNSPNDLTIRDDGTIYFTDPSYQCGSNCPQGSDNKRVYRVSPSGEVSTVPSDQGTPNGIALSPDQTTLYVAGDGPMEQFAVMADGSVVGPTPFSSVQGVDGLAIDCAGNVYATVHGQSKVDVYDPAGTLLGSLGVGAAVTNAAFGGLENKTLYVTRYDSELVSFDLDIPGLPY